MCKGWTEAEKAMWYRLTPHGYTSIIRGERFVLALDPLESGATVLMPLRLAVSLESDRLLTIPARGAS